jgi:hypothetical protein
MDTHQPSRRSREPQPPGEYELRLSTRRERLESVPPHSVEDRDFCDTEDSTGRRHVPARTGERLGQHPPLECRLRIPPNGKWFCFEFEFGRLRRSSRRSGRLRPRGGLRRLRSFRRLRHFVGGLRLFRRFLAHNEFECSCHGTVGPSSTLMRDEGSPVLGVHQTPIREAEELRGAMNTFHFRLARFHEHAEGEHLFPEISLVERAAEDDLVGPL